MAGNPRENVQNKGFWDGGSKRHGKSSEGAGRTAGYPGPRRPFQTGVHIDLDAPPVKKEEEQRKAPETTTPGS